MTEFNWQPRQLSNSFYRDYDIPPIYPMTPNINSIVQCIFDIAGTEVFNLSRSHIDFDFTVSYTAAQGTLTGGISSLTQVRAGTATYSYTAVVQTAGGATGNQTFTGPANTATASVSATAYPTLLALHLGKICPIQSIIFQTDSNIQLVNLTNAQQQSTSMYLPQTSIEKWLDRDLAEQAPALYPSGNRGDIIAPIRKPSYQQVAADGTFSAGTYSTTLANASSPGGVSINIGPEASGATVAPLPSGAGELACATLISTTSGAQGSIVMRYRINLGDYKNTLFALNKDLFFNRRMRMIINFEGLYRWGFTYQVNPNYVTPTSTLAGAADFTSTVFGGLGVGGNPVSNLTLRLALQSNETVASMVRQQVAVDGLRMLFPFTLCTNFTASTTSLQQFQVPINASLGQRLLRVYSVPINASNIAAAFCSNDNSTPAAPGAVNNLYSTIQTKLNARFMQDSQQIVSAQEDYRFMREMLKGSAIVSSEAFYQKSFFVDNFTSGDRSYMWDDDNTSIGGLELKRADGQSVDYVYSLLVTNTLQGTVYYVFPVVQRELVITKDNVLMI